MSVNAVQPSMQWPICSGDSLCYAFLGFDNEPSCEEAYFKMNNVLIDDRRIKVRMGRPVREVSVFRIRNAQFSGVGIQELRSGLFYARLILLLHRNRRIKFRLPVVLFPPVVLGLPMLAPGYKRTIRVGGADVSSRRPGLSRGEAGMYYTIYL